MRKSSLIAVLLATVPLSCDGGGGPQDAGPGEGGSDEPTPSDGGDEEPVEEPCPPEMVLVESDDLLPFCIDRFEHPGIEGQTPTVALPWHRASSACVDGRKSLCRGNQWLLACAGSPVESCGGEIGPTGSRQDCRSSLGVHDMPGNVAEWVAEPGGSVTWFAFGGNGGSGEIGCEVSEEIEAEASREALGFRCCRRANM